MSLLAPVWIEPTRELRDWLRTVTRLTNIVDQRIWAGGLPDDATLPAVVITRVGGGLDRPLDVGLYQFDCWASTGSGAAQLVSALLEVLYGTPSGTTAGKVTYGGCADDAQVVWLPDPVGDTPRYTVTAQVVTKTPNPSP